MLESHRHQTSAAAVQQSSKAASQSHQPAHSQEVRTKSQLANPQPHDARTSQIANEHARTFVDLKRAIAEFDAEPGVEVALPPVPTEDQLIGLFLKNAAILLKAKETRLAYNILRNVLMRQPENADALQMMGTSLKAENRYEDALKCLRAHAKIVKTPHAQAQVAELLYLCERDEAALASYRDVLKSVIVDADLLFEIYKNVGNIHTRARDFDSAEEYYDKAYTLRPQSDALLVNYGTLEIQRGAWNEAVTRFRSAVAINPDSDRAWVGLAMVHHSMGDFELAKANLQCALDINPANRTSLKLAVDWAQTDHDFAPAIERLQAYMGTKGGEDAEISFLLARTLVQAGQFRDARLEIERVLVLDPAFESADSLARALDRHLRSSEVCA